MVVEAYVLEESHGADSMDDLKPVRGHFITIKVEGQILVLQEHRESSKAIEKLADCVVFADFRPVLLSFAVSTLGLVLWFVEIHVVWPSFASLIKIVQSGLCRDLLVNWVIVVPLDAVFTKASIAVQYR